MIVSSLTQRHVGGHNAISITGNTEPQAFALFPQPSRTVRPLVARGRIVKRGQAIPLRQRGIGTHVGKEWIGFRHEQECLSFGSTAVEQAIFGREQG